MLRSAPEARLLTQGQAASYCGVCVDTFKKVCPVPPVSLLGRIPRYDRRALDRWIDSLNNSRPLDPDCVDLAELWNAGNDDTH